IPMMETNLAWEITTGVSSVIVAIIDTGIDTSHPEFTNRIHPNSYNSRTKEVGITKVVDDFGHGTMVAGIIGAIKDNSRGIAGIAPNISLLIIKANNAELGSFQDSSIIEGIYYAVDQGARIINLSLGGTYANPQTKVAIDYATAHGVIVVAASGNDGISTPMYPAAFEEVISVGAVDSKKTVASYSNFGTTIDIVAPGSEIITTVRNSGYGSGSGTSFAAPQVAGALALVLSHQSGLSVGELKARITMTALDRGAIGYDEFYGYGIVNTYKSMITDFHKVTFETGGGSKIPSIYMAHSTILSDLPTPTKENQFFEGWFLDEGYTIPLSPLANPLVEDITLYAKFNSSFHTVFYYDQTTLLRQEVIPHGEEFSTYIPTFENRVFEGWYLDELGTVPYESTPVIEDVKLYAKTRDFYIFTYTLYLNGEFINELLVTEGQEPNLPNMEEVGYVFDGWYIDSLYSIKYEVLPSVEDVSLYARRERIMLDVVFFIDGDLWKQISVPYGTNLSEEVDSIEGMRFMGWYLDAAFSQLYTGDGVKTSIELYGKWVSEVIEVQYIVNGSLWKEEVLEVGSILQVSPYLQAGSIFYGWFMDEAYLLLYESKLEIESIILYGYTEMKTFNVTFYDIFENVFETIQASYGDNLELDSTPPFPSTHWLTFTFLGWDKELSNISTNMDVFPL
ncbi:MAG: S8 family serine peptidase, partial [Candidatus Izemoplasmatales bacterium]|nr:S8 family serine peptidase [Candidatus Izemoplasmatales bacterium]